jgi:hypothetical protein
MKFGEENLSVELALAGLRVPVADSSSEDGRAAGCRFKDEDGISNCTEMQGTGEEACYEDPAEADTGLPVQFHLRKEIPSIVYSSPEEIVELHQSLNIARITPDGYVAQNARAYVCAARKSGDYSVDIGILLTDNDHILIYKPEKQPGAGDFRQVILHAIEFLETAGFLMDPLILGNDTKSRAKMLCKIPVLREEGRAKAK